MLQRERFSSSSSRTACLPFAAKAKVPAVSSAQEFSEKGVQSQGRQGLDGNILVRPTNVSLWAALARFAVFRAVSRSDGCKILLQGAFKDALMNGKKINPEWGTEINPPIVITIVRLG